jgi:hypothetical protein
MAAMFPGLWFGCFLIRDPDGWLTAARKALQHPVSFSLQDMAWPDLIQTGSDEKDTGADGFSGGFPGMRVACR